MSTFQDTKEITQEKLFEVIQNIYKNVTSNIPGIKTCSELADEYLKKCDGPFTAANKYAKYQIAKCTTSGFITSLGGIITLPVAIPANLASVLFVQLKMIATIATIGGYDVKDDIVETMCYVCLVGTTLTDLCKAAGVQIANKSVKALVQKLPGTVITKINQKMGFRLFTKFGEKGIINMHKLIPVVGGIVGGGVDLVTTKIIANRAIKMFVLDIIE